MYTKETTPGSFSSLAKNWVSLVVAASAASSAWAFFKWEEEEEEEAVLCFCELPLKKRKGYN